MAKLPQVHKWVRRTQFEQNPSDQQHQRPDRNSEETDGYPPPAWPFAQSKEQPGYGGAEQNSARNVNLARGTFWTHRQDKHI